MDRGIPTEKVREQMRASEPPIQYLVGTPRGRLSQYEQPLLGQPWQGVREGVSVKLLVDGQELYVLAESKDRVNKERAMRRRQLKGLGKRLSKTSKTNWPCARFIIDWRIGLRRTFSFPSCPPAST
jgi:hypothetical protein